jgi:hypothetical protein
MSTYSPSLRIELITTGTQAGTWGNTTNTNLGELIESAIAGYTSVSITSANQALTALNGAADQSRNMSIALTTTTTAVFNVYAPPAEKTYVIYNASAYAATIYNSTVLGNTTAAGTGVAIPAGKTMTVWSDGTNFRVQNDHLSSLTLTTPLAVAQGGTGTNTSTGTGSTVLSASPALTGTPTAPSMGLGDATMAIANTSFVQAAIQRMYPVGSIYINAGVTTNPATLFGFGTWVAFGAGRVMVGLNAGDPLFDVLEETGGSKDAIVVAHTHTGNTNTTGGHQHFAVYNGGTDSSSQYSPTVGSTKSLAATGGGGGFELYTLNGTSQTPDGGLTSTAGTHSHSFTTDSTGSSGTNANLQPYITVAMWKRTA